MVDGYRKVYHDRSHTDIHFRGVLPKMDSLCRWLPDNTCTLGWGLYLLKDNNDNKKRIR